MWRFAWTAGAENWNESWLRFKCKLSGNACCSDVSSSWFVGWIVCSYPVNLFCSKLSSLDWELGEVNSLDNYSFAEWFKDICGTSVVECWWSSMSFCKLIGSPSDELFTRLLEGWVKWFSAYVFLTKGFRPDTGVDSFTFIVLEPEQLVKSSLKVLTLWVSSKRCRERHAHISIASSLSSEDPFANTSVAITFICSNRPSVFCAKLFKELIWVPLFICDCKNSIDRLISILASLNLLEAIFAVIVDVDEWLVLVSSIVVDSRLTWRQPSSEGNKDYFLFKKNWDKLKSWKFLKFFPLYIAINVPLPAVGQKTAWELQNLNSCSQFWNDSSALSDFERICMITGIRFPKTPNLEPSNPKHCLKLLNKITSFQFFYETCENNSDLVLIFSLN